MPCGTGIGLRALISASPSSARIATVVLKVSWQITGGASRSVYDQRVPDK